MTAIKQNNKYIETKLKHNLENFTKTLHDEELSFVRITELFNKEQKKYVCGKTVSSENNVKIEQDVQDVIQNITRVTKDVHEIKEGIKKTVSEIDKNVEIQNKVIQLCDLISINICVDHSKNKNYCRKYLFGYHG